MGVRTDKANAPVNVSLFVGGTPASAADVNSKFNTANPLETVVGATLVDTIQLAALSTSGTTEEKTASLSSGTGFTIGDPL
ncbi:MAG: hypothetical protein HRT88_20250, partial [Lentisphaeraceae bacterium]|nr:hypothetical protein [Lentisphaeraceae bacterium]